jgi:hypothetical protein
MGAVEGSLTEAPTAQPVLPAGQRCRWANGAPRGPARDPAELLLAMLLSSSVRKGSLARSELDRQRSVLLHPLRQRIARGLPIQLTLMAFPFKVPNPAKVGARRLPDLAEATALRRLGRLRAALAEAYPLSVELELILDGQALAPAIGVPADEVSGYVAYLRRLLDETGVAGFVRLHDLDDLLNGDRRLAAARRAHAAEATAWWHSERGTAGWRAAFRKMAGMVNLRELSVAEAEAVLGAAEGGALPARFAEVERRIGRAMIAYREFDMLVHRLDPRPHCFPEAIHATVTERPGRLAIWLVRRGRSHLPWHGVGAVEADGHVHVQPLASVLERGGYRAVHRHDEDTPFFYRRSE